MTNIWIFYFEPKKKKITFSIKKLPYMLGKNVFLLLILTSESLAYLYTCFYLCVLIHNGKDSFHTAIFH